MTGDIPTQLILLFDGKTPRDIVELVLQALPAKDRYDFAYQAAYQAGVNIGSAICPGDILDEINIQNEMGPEQYKLAITEDELANWVRNHEWHDQSDAWGEARNILFDELCKAEAIVCELPEELPTE